MRGLAAKDALLHHGLSHPLEAGDVGACHQGAPECKPAPFDLVPTLAGVCKSIPALMAAMQNPFQAGSSFLPRNNETGRRLQPTACFQFLRLLIQLREPKALLAI